VAQYGRLDDFVLHFPRQACEPVICLAQAVDCLMGCVIYVLHLETLETSMLGLNHIRQFPKIWDAGEAELTARS
jgi:hypothetical protein